MKMSNFWADVHVENVTELCNGTPDVREFGFKRCSILQSKVMKLSSLSVLKNYQKNSRGGHSCTPPVFLGLSFCWKQILYSYLNKLPYSHWVLFSCAFFSFLISLVAQVASVLVFMTFDLRPSVRRSWTVPRSSKVSMSAPKAAQRSLIT